MEPPAGPDGFIAGLDDCGVTAVVHHDVVTLEVTPVTGTHAGEHVLVGVAIDELGGWPTVPPHWVHMSDTVRFNATNLNPSPIPGWVRHSRGTANWGDATHPAQAYLAHLRCVVGEAA